MANCKVCLKRIDFDEKDPSAQIGENIISVYDVLTKIPVYGKFAYIRRGRWYWHVECYPDKLSIGKYNQEEYDLALGKAIDELREDSIPKGLHVKTAEHLKIAEDLLTKTSKERNDFSDTLTIQEESIKRLVLEKEEVEKEKEEVKRKALDYRERARIIKDDYDRVGRDKVALSEENAKLKKDLEEFEKLKTQLETLGVNVTPK